MSEAIRARFHCNSITDFQYVKQTELTAVYGKEGENADFAKATPSGSIKIGIDKETPAADFFEPGEEYYVTFTKVEKKAS